MTQHSGLVVENGLLFDGVTSDLREHRLVIREGSIVDDDSGPESHLPVLDARGRVVVPGLIDAHFHAYGASLDFLRLESMPKSYVVAHAANRLQKTLKRGFTTIRDVGGGDIGIVDAIDEGLIEGPRYLFSGRALSQTGGHGDPRPNGLDLCCRSGHMAEVVDGVDNVRRVVRERLRTGAHVIKVFATGGVVSPTDPLRLCQYSSEELSAIADEAKRRQSYVAAHAYSPEGITHAIDNGVRTIEHGNLLDEPTAAAMAAASAYLVPTLIAYDAMARRGADLGLSGVGLAKNLDVLHAGMGSLAIARAAGVPIGLGTDLMGNLEDEQLAEFRLRVECGSVLEALRSATSVNAEIIGRPDLGNLDVGTPADLVVLAGNPFDDPAVLWDSARTVVRKGVVVTA